MNSAQVVHALTGMNTRKHPPRQISFASFSPPVDCVRQIAGSTQKNGSDSRAQGTLNADQVQKNPWHLAACQSAGNSDVQSANEAMTVLECQGIDRRFGGLAAVTGVDLRIDRGEIVGWIGPNGSGKATLVNAVTGFYPPQKGRILPNGMEITGMKPHKVARQHVARSRRPGGVRALVGHHRQAQGRGAAAAQSNAACAAPVTCAASEKRSWLRLVISCLHPPSTLCRSIWPPMAQTQASRIFCSIG